MTAPQRPWAAALLCVAACGGGEVGLRSDGGEAAPITKPAGVIARARTLEGRAGHSVVGSMALVRTATGSLQLVFSDDFQVSDVPLALVVMSDRSELGNGLTEDDVQLGTLRSTRGAQSYKAPANVEDLAYAWLFCVPYQVEVAKGPLARAE